MTQPAITRFAPLCALIFVGYAIYVANEYRLGYRAAARGERPLFTDYTTLHAAAMQLRAESAETLYLPRRVHEYQLRVTAEVYGAHLSETQARSIGYSAWMYPPTFLLFAFPLAYLPYLWALLVWLMSSGSLYVVVIRKILGPGGGWIAASAPPTFFNMMYGQTGFLSAGLIGLGIYNFWTRPVLAGLFVGLASFKPHLGILVPVALIAAGNWTAFLTAAATVLGLAILSVAVFGMDPWFGFIGASLANVGGFAAGAYAWAPMTSVLSTAFGFGSSIAWAWRAQLVAALLMMAAVFWVWRRGRAFPETRGLQSAILCLATPLAVPMVYLYDLAIIVPGAAWVMSDFRQFGATRLERVVFMAGFYGLIGALVVAHYFGLQIGSVLIAVMLGLAIRRFTMRSGASGLSSRHPASADISRDSVFAERSG